MVTAVSVSVVSAQTFRVKVIKIADGDTFTGLNRDSLQLRFRIQGIDAPEKKQDFGQKSKAYLSSLIFGHDITVRVEGSDRYGRFLAYVQTPDGEDVGLLMLSAGMAWHYQEYDSSAEYDKAEKKARARKLGLWSIPSAVAPWNYRKEKK